MQRQLILVIIILLALATAGALLFRENKQQDIYEFTQHNLLTELDSNFASTKQLSLKRLRIVRQNKVLVDAVEQNGNWATQHLSTAKNFPLVKDKLVSFMRELTNADVIEYKSAKPQHHKILGLQDVSPSNSDTTEVLLETTDGTSFVVLLGHAATSQYGQYVRPAKQDQMMLINTVLAPPSEHVSWLEADLFDVPTASIVSIERMNPDYYSENTSKQSKRNISEVLWTMVANEHTALSNTQISSAEPDRQFRIKDLPEEQELAESTVFIDFIENLNSMQFIDVLPFDETAFDVFQPSVHFQVSSVDGRIRELNIRQHNQRYYAHITRQGEHEKLSAWLFEIPDSQLESVKLSVDAFIQVEESN